MKKYRVYEDIIKWLGTHNGNFPKANITRNGKKLKVNEMTEQEKEEVRLANNWRRTPEYHAYVKYRDSELSQIPEEYQGIVDRLKLNAKKTTHEMVKEWLKSHNGKTPRKNIEKKGRRLKTNEMTEEEKQEVNLNQRWKMSKEYKIFKKYIGEKDENIPKKYIKIIREYRELMQPDSRILKIMRKAVGKKVGANEATRKELGLELENQKER